MDRVAAESLDDLRAAHARLLAVHELWRCEAREGAETPPYEDPIPVASRMEEAFRQFAEAAESIGHEIESPRSSKALGLAYRLRTDFATARFTFSALLNSWAKLNPLASGAVGRTYQSLLSAAEAHERGARALGEIVIEDDAAAPPPMKKAT